MAASVEFRPHNRDLGVVMREVDEDLAIFLGMKTVEKDRTLLAQVDNFEEFDNSTSVEPKPDGLLVLNGLGEEAFQSLVDDSLLNLETSKSDHDWLLSQQDADEQDLTADNANVVANGECNSHNSELQKSEILDSSAATKRRPLSCGGRKPSSRAPTPTRRPSLPAKLKPSRASTPTPRAPSKTAATTSSKPMTAQVRSSIPSSRTTTPASTPSSRTTTPAATLRPTSRSSTPSRVPSRSSTPTARNVSSSKPASCSAAPTRKPATPTSSTISGSGGASSGGKTNSAPTKNVSGGSQKVKSRPSKVSDMLSVSHNAPESVKTSMPKRPASASRGRPSAPSAALSSPSKGKPRQKSCSPARARAPIGIVHKKGSTMLSRNRGYSHGGGGDDDDVNPVLMGTQMVERVVNMRKLAPPKQDEHVSVVNPKKSSHENSGFGRSLSKKSLDMAMRHMDIRRSVAGNLKPVATSVVSYFSNGNQSSSSQNSSFGISESPITSCSDSSKSSNCGDSYFA